ncbi:MAG: sodium:proton antiporter [Chitinophagaceae bacterium]|nr:MAG: sodium:proton antiporter [Chitinophagaceae bacterium]
MTSAIIITLCVLLLIAYLFDLTSSKTKIPSVILLLLLGFIVRKLTDLLDIPLPDLSPVLPVLGTVGLILIVLEGSLELEFNATKMPLIRRSFAVALFPMLALAFGLAWVLQQVGGGSFKDSLTNAIPLCVISSAIAIPSVKSLGQHTKEFVIYESSLSDILGVLLFNFVALNEFFDLHTVGDFFIQLLVIAAVSFIATIGLALLLSRIDHHIKFAPIILLVILIYAISKVYHLPGLIFILLFGLFLGNLDELNHIKWIQKLNPVALNREVHKFREITTEAAFLIRALFFLLFGYLIETAELLNTQTLIWAIGIVVAIFLLRAIQLRLSRLQLKPLLFIAPRGLITILLFLSISPSGSIPLVNRSLVIQVVILSALVMMMGLMTTQSGAKQKE